MGVERDFYIILGYELKIDEFNDWWEDNFDTFDEYAYNPDGGFIQDGMLGEYVYFGKVLYHSGQYQNTTPKVIFTPDNDDMLEIRDKVKNIIGLDKIKTDNGSLPNIIAFEHCH